MKFVTLALGAAGLLFHQAAASLNCTLAAPAITARYCEWEGCKAHTTAKVGDVLHAGCRADCSTPEDPWFQLYDGSFVRTHDLTDCRYFCKPWNNITGLPYCAWERNATAPNAAQCAASSASGIASLLKAPVTIGPEPSPFAGTPTSGTACDWITSGGAAASKTSSAPTVGGTATRPIATKPPPALYPVPRVRRENKAV